jgi:hypothetical protein
MFRRRDIPDYAGTLRRAMRYICGLAADALDGCADASFPDGWAAPGDGLPGLDDGPPEPDCG